MFSECEEAALEEDAFEKQVVIRMREPTLGNYKVKGTQS